MKKNVLKLKPTQFCLGMKEVEFKVKRLKRLSAKHLAEYLEEQRIPVVKGPDGNFYMIDHHHFARACWESNILDVPVKVVAKYDKNTCTMDAFWWSMKKIRYTFTYDQFNNGPHNPYSLPVNIRGMADDPYRSLAWAVRHAKGFEKNDEPFFEFKWAKFFRSKISLEIVRNDFKGAIQKAIRLCRTPAASKLPGYIKVKK
jgi:hypothetical protein